MIMFGSLLVCLAVTVVFYFIDPKRILWWEFFIPIGVMLILIFGMKALVEYTSVQFTEYWGETITSIYEEEPYNYWHTETCSETYACGTDSKGNTQYCTRYYDCSHQDDVGPSWSAKTNLGNEINISEHLYDSLKRVYGGNRIKVNTRENYSSRSIAVNSRGTKFEDRQVGDYSYTWKVDWPKDDATRKGYFSVHSYENRIKASDLSLFNISVVTDEEADSLGLYKYPDLHDNFSYPTILGGKPSQKVKEYFNKLNAKFGPRNKLRLWILIFDNKPATLGAYQENYWVKGNKNELVICIGTKGEEITWTHAFSWALSADLTAEVAQQALNLYSVSVETESGQKLPVAIPINTQLKESISKATGIDTTMLPPILPLGIKNKEITKITKGNYPVLNEQTWMVYYNYLNANLDRFRKRSFEEFSYIKVVPKTWVVVLLYILALAISIGVNLWTFNNEFTDEHPRGSQGYRNWY